MAPLSKKQRVKLANMFGPTQEMLVACSILVASSMLNMRSRYLEGGMHEQVPHVCSCSST